MGDDITIADERQGSLIKGPTSANNEAIKARSENMIRAISPAFVSLACEEVAKNKWGIWKPIWKALTFRKWGRCSTSKGNRMAGDSTRSQQYDRRLRQDSLSDVESRISKDYEDLGVPHKYPGVNYFDRFHCSCPCNPGKHRSDCVAATPDDNLPLYPSLDSSATDLEFGFAPALAKVDLATTGTYTCERSASQVKDDAGKWKDVGAPAPMKDNSSSLYQSVRDHEGIKGMDDSPATSTFVLRNISQLSLSDSFLKNEDWDELVLV